MDTPRREIGHHRSTEGVVGADGFVYNQAQWCGGREDGGREVVDDGVRLVGREVDEAAFGDEEGWEGRIDVL